MACCLPSPVALSFHNNQPPALSSTHPRSLLADFLPVLELAGTQPSQVTYFHPEGSKMDLNLAFFPHGQQYVVGMEYNADLFTQMTAQSFLDSYAALLTAGLAEPARPVSTLPLMTALQKERMFKTLASGGCRGSALVVV